MVACVAENRLPYSREVVYLYESLVAFGGTLAGAQKVAYFVEAADPWVAEELARLGITVKLVERFSDTCPHANKIQMLDDSEDCEYLVALDTDVVITKDFGDIVAGNTIRAKPVDDDPLPLETWQKTFEYFGLALSPTRFLTTFSLKETITYFNSGVLVIPREHINPLAKSWGRFIWKLADAYKKIPELSRHQFFTDQFALTLALADTRLPYMPLPIEMNFPSHLPIHPAYSPASIDPYVIHHHHRISDSGELLPCGYEQADRRIAQINRMIASRGDRLTPTNMRKDGGISNGAEFWEKRYADNSILGSGVGSQGDSLLYKKRILQSVLDRYLPSSVLDVGCGDIEVAKDLNFTARYLGTDLSRSVIERNRAKKPGWAFVVGDIRTLPDDVAADMVICLDVLIHAPTLEDYESLLNELLRRSARNCVISGYETRPRNRFSSDITAYYEPITYTLRRFGANGVRLIGSYRDTCIVFVEKSGLGVVVERTTS